MPFRCSDQAAEVATEQSRLGRTAVVWPLTQTWVTGALLESSDEIDHGTVVLMIDLPPDELPWPASNGIESSLIDDLRSGAVSDLIEPDRAELVEQADVQLKVSKAHLRSILDQYWDHEWRRNNRSHTSPEDQLWRAATAVTELEDALCEFDP